MAPERKSRSKPKAKYSPEEVRHLQALGEAVRTLREKHTKFSRFKFSFEIDGVHRNTMNGVENGTTAPSFVTLLRITEGIGVSMSDLMKEYEKILSSQAKPSTGSAKKKSA